MAQLLIDQAYLRARSIINDNTDYELIKPIIVLCQDIYIKPLLGNNLYNQIAAQAIAGTIAGPNKIILDDYIQTALLWYVQAESTVIFKFRFTNKGIMEKSSDNSQPSSTDDIKFVKQDFFNKAEKYGQLMITYIKNHTGDFPDYYNNTEIGAQPEKTAFKSPFYIENRGFGCGPYRNPKDNYYWPWQD